MRKISFSTGFLIILLLLTSLNLIAQNLQVEWVKQAGGNGDDKVKSIATDKTGNVYVTGYFYDKIIFGDKVLITNDPNQANTYIAKYSNAGNLQWVKQLKGEALPKTIEVDDLGNIYLTGNFLNELYLGKFTLVSSGDYDLFITKLDATGNVLWASKAGGQNTDFVNDLAVDKAGSVYITGYFINDITFDKTRLTAPNRTLFIAKYSSIGNLEWAEQGKTSKLCAGHTVNTDQSGNIYLTGYFSGSVSLGSITLQNDHTLDQGFIGKLTSSGEIKWLKKAGEATEVGTTADGPTMEAAVDGSGNLYVTGSLSKAKFDEIIVEVTYEEFDKGPAGMFQAFAFVAKFDGSGKAQWARKVIGVNVNSIAVDKSGNAFITGAFGKAAVFEKNILTSNPNCSNLFVAGYDSKGNLNLVHNDYICGFDNSIALDKDGSILLSGSFYEKTTFGEITLKGSGSEDVFVAKFKRK